MTASGAEPEAHSWLRALGLSPAVPACPWRLARRPERVKGSWYVRFLSGGRTGRAGATYQAIARLHAASGDLVTLRV